MTPKLRFPGFTDKWGVKTLGDLFNFSVGKNIKQNEASPRFKTPCVRYGELYHLYDEVIRDVVNRTNIPASELLFSKGDEILLPSAGEDPMDIGSASALTIRDVAIGRTINILRPKTDNDCHQIFAAYYINTILRRQISKLAKGVSISNVYNSDLRKLSMRLPGIEEQQRIGDILTAVDYRIAAIDKRIKLLKKYKKGVMQKIFTQKIRFKDQNGNQYPDWGKPSLRNLLELRSVRNTQSEVKEVFSVAKNAGVINQIEHLGRSYASKDISNYKIVEPHDVIYTKSPTSDFPYGIVKQNKLGRRGVVSVLYGVYKPTNRNVGYLLDTYFNSWKNTFNYLNPIVQKGAKNTINIGDSAFLEGAKILFPMDASEQQKIADFLTAIDDKIKLEEVKLTQAKKFKKSLLQRMFV